MTGDDPLYQQVLEALRQSEARYRHLTEFATDVIYTHTLDGRLITINQAGERLLGYSREEFIGKNILDVIVAEHREIARRATEQEVLAGNGTAQFTVDVETRFGHRVTLEINTHILLDQGKPIAVQGIARDVTERHRATQALTEREQFYRTITERSADLILIMDAHATIRYASPSFDTLFGYATEKLVGTSGFDMVSPDDLPDAKRLIERLVTEKLESLSGEYHIKDADGRYRDVEFRARNLLDDPVIGGIVIDARDVTERRHAEHALRVSEDRFRKILDLAAEGIAQRDENGRLTFVNGRFAGMLGYEVDELIGKHIDEIVTPRFRAEHQASAERRRRSRIAETMDTEFVRKDGSVMPAILSVSPTFDGEGNFTGALGMITDISERKYLEEQLRQSQKMEAVGRLAGGVAHGFNNLLTSIEGHVDLILAELSGPTAIRNDVIEIRRAAENAAALTQQLLAFSRRQMLQPVVLDVDEVLHELEAAVRSRLPDGITLVTRYQAGGARIKADRSQFEQTVLNLVDNASDAMPDGGELRISTGTVDIDLEFVRMNRGALPGSYVCLSVSDTGIGMDEDTLQHVFEPFFTTKAIGKGVGLGLATAYGIIKQSDGYIRAVRTPPGSTFEVYLPRVHAPVRTARQPSTNGHPTGDQTILVAEDEAAVRALTCRILRKHGYHVLEASDGREAIDVARSFAGRINLLVTDVIMPNVGGRELSEQLGELMPDLKVLFMSGYTDDQLLQRGVLQSGSGNFLEKPFTPDALARKVREVLDRE